MNTMPRTQTRDTLTLARTLRPLPVFERRERGFGIGYGNSSGYASSRCYVPGAATARFRFK